MAGARTAYIPMKCIAAIPTPMIAPPAPIISRRGRKDTAIPSVVTPAAMAKDVTVRNGS
jgi:hypothetical protein